MTRFPMLTVLLAAGLGACSSATIGGTLKDGLTGAPIPEIRVIAKATSESASLSCQAFEAVTGADGAFKIDGACTGTGYSLSLGDDSWWVPDMPDVADGGRADLALAAWRNSKGNGVYKLDGANFDALRTSADVKSEKILDSEEKVRFPWPSVPGNVPRLKKGQHLVLVGANTLETYEIFPLVRSEARKFGDKDTWVTMDPWYYIGIEFTDDKTFTRVAAEIDASKVVEKRSDQRAGKYIPAEAIKPGRYVILPPDARTVTIFDVGDEPPAGG